MCGIRNGTVLLKVVGWVLMVLVQSMLAVTLRTRPHTVMSSNTNTDHLVALLQLLSAHTNKQTHMHCRWVSKHCDPVAATAWHMVLGGLMLAGAALVADGDSGELAARLSQFNSSDALAMAYVSLFGGAASYGIFFYEATHGSLTAISSLTFLTPVFAAGAGYLLLGETLTPLQLVGATVTLSAVFAINTPGSHKDNGSAQKKEA